MDKIIKEIEEITKNIKYDFTKKLDQIEVESRINSMLNKHEPSLQARVIGMEGKEIKMVLMHKPVHVLTVRIPD